MVHVVALSESRTWDSRWLKYLDYLATAIMAIGEDNPDMHKHFRCAGANRDSCLSSWPLKLTVERNVETFPRVIELALRGKKELRQYEEAKPRSAVVVIVSGVRPSHVGQLERLARRLRSAGAPPVGVFHLQSWRPWEEAARAAVSRGEFHAMASTFTHRGFGPLVASYADPAFSFVRRQHHYRPLAVALPAAISAPLMPAYYAEHVFSTSYGSGDKNDELSAATPEGPSPSPSPSRFVASSSSPPPPPLLLVVASSAGLFLLFTIIIGKASITAEHCLPLRGVGEHPWPAR